MSDAVKIGFVPFSTAPSGTVIVFTDETLKLGRRTAKALGSATDSIKRAAAAAKFKGKSRSVLEMAARPEHEVLVGVEIAVAPDVERSLRRDRRIEDSEVRHLTIRIAPARLDHPELGRIAERRRKVLVLDRLGDRLGDRSRNRATEEAEQMVVDLTL